ncbi:MAG: LolA-related protein [Gammaproteobacteria bacterium]|nr:LolA-related protein [Gammaproteobacteria bacterium]
MRLLLAAIGLWLTSAGSAEAPAAGGPPPAAEDVLARVAAQPGERVHFEERRFNELLSEPLVLQGYVSMDDQGTLTRVVEQPFQERATLDGDTATLQRDGRERRVSLDRGGAAAAYLRALYALLRGDEAILRERFEMQTSGTAQDWQLRLAPTERRLRRRLESITVRGAGETVAGIRMQRADGAWQDMRFEQRAP